MKLDNHVLGVRTTNSTELFIIMSDLRRSCVIRARITNPTYFFKTLVRVQESKSLFKKCHCISVVGFKNTILIQTKFQGSRSQTRMKFSKFFLSVRLEPIKIISDKFHVCGGISFWITVMSKSEFRKLRRFSYYTVLMNLPKTTAPSLVRLSMSCAKTKNTQFGRHVNYFLRGSK